MRVFLAARTLTRLAAYAARHPLPQCGRGVVKANFDPDEPRIPKGEPGAGQWTDSDGDPGEDGGEEGDGTAGVIPAQELLPFAARPPLFLDEPPQTVRPFKQPIPRLSGQEGAKDIPSWARGSRPYVGENGRDFARRLMDQRYGPGNWAENNPEYRRLQKFGDRNFRDPRSILGPDEENDPRDGI